MRMCIHQGTYSCICTAAWISHLVIATGLFGFHLDDGLAPCLPNSRMGVVWCISERKTEPSNGNSEIRRVIIHIELALALRFAVRCLKYHSLQLKRRMDGANVELAAVRSSSQRASSLNAANLHNEGAGLIAGLVWVEFQLRRVVQSDLNKKLKTDGNTKWVCSKAE